MPNARWFASPAKITFFKLPSAFWIGFVGLVVHGMELESAASSLRIMSTG
jgi:hypothetical protein